MTKEKGRDSFQLIDDQRAQRSFQLPTPRKQRSDDHALRTVWNLDVHLISRNHDVYCFSDVAGWIKETEPRTIAGSLQGRCL